MTSEYVTGKYIRDDVVEDRDYQTELVNNADSESSLIALPTGTGKTPVAVRIAARRLEQPGGRVLMLAPTNPLVQQHYATFAEMLTIPESEIQIFNGSDTRPAERKELWEQPNSIIIATPQVIENDLVANRYDLSNVCHLIFDECHRATGDYAYNYIGERYNGNAETPVVTGMSASPGTDKEKILNVCKNLGITNIEIITADNPSLKRHLAETEIEEKWLDMPGEITESADTLRGKYRDAQKKLKNLGFMSSARKDQSLTRVNNSIGKIQDAKNSGDSGRRSKAFKGLSARAEAMKLYQAIDRLESQGPEQALKYFDKLEKEVEAGDAAKATQRIVSDPEVRDVIRTLREYDGTNPKFSTIALEVMDVIRESDEQPRVIIFTESRDTVSEVVDFLDNGGDMVNPHRFVGQSDKDGDPGMSQTEQKEILDEFREGTYNVLVATSVAEEGLDIPAVDLVVFYEPIPSAVRAIQRRGRTGRERDGRVVMLIGKGTQDESKYFISKRQEEKMIEDMKTLKDMEDDLEAELEEEQADLSEFGEREVDEDTPVVICDTREDDSGIMKMIDRMDDVRPEIETLEVGDFVVSDRVAIERKAADDFLNTITGERGYDQIADLASNYDRPAVYVEVDTVEGLYNRRNIPREAIRSALATISHDFGVSILFTGDTEGTAKQLRTIARREQEDEDRDVSLHASKSKATDSEKQEYVISAFPNVEAKRSRKLLNHFGSIYEVVTATPEELAEVDGIGEKTAVEVHNLIRKEYGNSE